MGVDERAAASRGTLARGTFARTTGAARRVVVGCSLACSLGCSPGIGRPAAPGIGPPAAPGTTSSSPAAARATPSCGDEIPGQEPLTGPLVLVGEMHGTAEIPATFGRLVCHAAARQPGRTFLVTLEIPVAAQASIDAFLESDGRPEVLLRQEFWQREYQDGRSSRAMLALLEQFHRHRSAGLRIVVRAIDPPSPASPGERDAGMARAILAGMESLRPFQTYALMGNVHSRTLEGYPWDPAADYLPAGALLRAKHEDLIALNTACRGSAWTCTSAEAKDCGVHEVRSRGEPPGSTPRIVLDAESLPRTGHHGILFMGEVTASEPARTIAGAFPTRSGASRGAWSAGDAEPPTP